MAEEREPLLRHAGTSAGSRGHGSISSPRVNRSLSESSQFSRLSQRSKMRHYVKQCCSVENAKNKLPITKWLPKYSLQDLQCDLISGLTVALTVLPQGLAYAIIANLPQQYGLYSAFMGCFVYTLLGTSKDITLGPTAIMSLMTAAFASSPVENDATYAIILCLFSGLVQLLMGVLHLGILVNFISYPVINAFTSAAAITIACGQVKGILGLKHIPRDFLEMVYETCKHIPETNVWDMTMGLICLVILIIMKQLRKIKWKDPEGDAPLPMRTKVFRKAVWLVSIGANAIIVVSASGVVAILHSYGHNETLSITGKVQAGLPPFRFPSTSLQNGNETIAFTDILGDIGPGLIIVPLLGLIESIAIGKAFARQNNYKIIPNQELLAIGAANIASSFVSAYPVTGSFSRTAVNSMSGVRTPLAGVVTGGVIIMALAFLTPLFQYIPKSALSAVIISAVISMVDYEIILKLWRVQKMALIPWTLTFLTSFGLGIEYGILIGIGVQILMLLYPVARPKISVFKNYKPQNVTSESLIGEVQYLDYIVVTFNQAIRFPSVEYIQMKLAKEMNNGGSDGKPRSVVLDCTHLAQGLDYTTIQGIIEIMADFKRNDVHFAMACVLDDIKQELANAEITNVIYGDTVDDAIRKIKEAEKQNTVDELESITVSNGKISGHMPVNGSPLPNVPETNYGYESDSLSERL